MNRILLIKKPELFQGEKYLNMNKNYFEGWYFKNTNENTGISFIPGININNKEKKSFIQIITNNSSYFVNYSINDFKFNFEPFYIKIKDNFFSKEKIHLDIIDNIQNLKIKGDIKYINGENININSLNPNIMGPFSYIPFMECNHAILSMKNRAIGEIKVNDDIIKFNKGTGYIEKDWGCSFPKSYIWCQGNNFKNYNASFMLAIARVTFTRGEIFKVYEYVYTGQTEGIDSKNQSKMTGFITIPDDKFKEIDTPNVRVTFVEFIGVTDREVNAVRNKEIKVKELYEKIGSDVTDYNRKSVI